MCAIRSRVGFSTQGPGRLMARTATAALAIAIAIHAGDNDNGLMTRPGSGTISTAPIAVKWGETIASVSNTPAVKVPDLPLRWMAIHRLAAPNIMPMRTDTATRSQDHAIWPGISKADIPR